MFWTWIDRPYDIPAFDLMMLISERLFECCPSAPPVRLSTHWRDAAHPDLDQDQRRPRPSWNFVRCRRCEAGCAVYRAGLALAVDAQRRERRFLSARCAELPRRCGSGRIAWRSIINEKPVEGREK